MTPAPPRVGSVTRKYLDLSVLTGIQVILAAIVW